MDEHGYPTEDELKIIEEWSDWKNYLELMAYIKRMWRFKDSGCWTQEDNVYYISTSGWSGNERIISALRSNLTFWGMCWESHRRGGHYEFILPKWD